MALDSTKEKSRKSCDLASYFAPRAIKQVENSVFPPPKVEGLASRTRPPLPKNTRMGVRMEVRVAESEKRALVKAASKSGIGLSEWTRDRLRRAAEQEGFPPQEPLP